MAFPFNHNTSNVTHTHHHNPRDDEEYPPPGHQPPPPYFANTYPPPPPQHHPETQVFHTGHVSRNNYDTPPQQHLPETQVFHTGHVSHNDFNNNYGASAYPPAPPSVPDHSSVHHVSHETHNPHFPSTTVHHVDHQVNTVPPPPIPLSSNKPTFKILTKASPNFSLTIRRGEVVLAPSNPSDQYQHWYKDEKWSTRVKDKESHPSFCLVNKVTGEAIKHSVGATHPVRLVRYNPDYLDQSILWTESKDQGSGYKAVRMVNNIQLNMDAFHGDKNSGGVQDGTTVVLWDWNNGDNQQWKILPYCS